MGKSKPKIIHIHSIKGTHIIFCKKNLINRYRSYHKDLRTKKYGSTAHKWANIHFRMANINKNSLRRVGLK